MLRELLVVLIFGIPFPDGWAAEDSRPTLSKHNNLHKSVNIPIPNAVQRYLEYADWTSIAEIERGLRPFFA